MSIHPRTGSLLAASLLAVTAIGCGSGGDAANQGPDQSPVPGTRVSVVDNAFEPSNLQVEAGETVTWTWEGSNPHDVSADEFASDLMTSGTFTHTFEEPGTHDYVCTIHAGMEATVEVVSS